MMRSRLLLLASLAAFSGVAHGQTPYPGILSGLRELQRRQVIPFANQDPPTVPAPADPLPPKYGDLPPADADTENGQLKIVRGGTSLRREGNFVHAEGGVEVLYKGYHVFADIVDANLSTSIFDLQGNVRVIGKDNQVVVGDRVLVDFVNNTYHAYDAETQLSPAQVQGNLRDFVYVKARQSFGGARDTRSLDAHLTTCNLPHPHYGIVSEDLVVRPGKRAIFRRAKVQLFGKTLFTIPYLSIPLNQPRYNYLPEVGRSNEEGYYIKNRYGIPLRGEDVFDARLDYMEKLGIGYGGDYQYRGNNIAGVSRFYAISGQGDTLTLNNQHRQDFRWGSFALDNDYQRNNYVYAPGQTSLNTRAMVSTNKLGGDTRLSYQRTGTQSSFGDSENRSVSLSDQRSLSRTTRTTLDVNWTTNRSAFGESSNSQEQLDVRFRGQQDFRTASASLDYQRSIPIGESSGFFGGADRTPVLTLTSDAQRLLGGRFAQEWPFQTDLSIGEYADSGAQGRITRTNFGLNVNRPDRSQRRFRFDTNAIFKQSFYSDDTAQYTLGLNNALSYRLGRNSSANFRYSYLRPYGFSPMLIDQSGETNLATADVNYRPLRTALVGVQTGYDIMRLRDANVAWQQVGVRTEYQPAPNVLLRSLYTYDTFQQVWSNVRIDTTWKPGATTFSLGARYDGFRKVWGNLNLFVDSLKIGRTRVSAILAYNGYTQKVDAQQYQFTYDLHCAEAVLSVVESTTGFRPGREIQFFVRLKAFPFDSLFGRGGRGQPIGVGTGRDF